MFDLLIKSARIIDGSGNPWFPGDIGMVKDRIAAVGRLREDAAKVIHADGKVVAPGFIDVHSHSDLFLMASPESKPKVMQGVTTEVVGQDGLSEAPITTETLADWRKYLSGLNGDPEIEWNWRSFGEYLDALTMAQPSINAASLVGHGNLRLLTLGMENRQPSTAELAKMKQILREAMAQGAFGMSTGLIYAPCVYADTSELTELCRVVAELNGIFAVHMRDEGDQLFESIDEVIAVGEESETPVHISHFKASGRRNWGKVNEALLKLEKARSRGIDVTIEQYPYVAGSTFLSSLLPAWAHEGGTNRMLARLRDKTLRERIVQDISTGRSRDWTWNGVLVTSVTTEKNRAFEGRTLTEISEALRKRPVDALLDIIAEEDNAATMVSFSMSENDVRTVMQSRYQMVCTDGIMLGRPHPRVYGSFPRVLGRYVRNRVLRLEDAVRRMTSYPARRLGLQDRGLIRPGMAADIVVFDPSTVIDTATFEDPHRFPIGIEQVVVNGVLTVDKAAHTGARAGRILRHNQTR